MRAIDSRLPTVGERVLASGRVVSAALLFAGVAACSHVHLRSPIAAPAGPPPTFLATTSDARSTRVIDVRDGVAKPNLLKAASDLLTQRYTVDVNDPRAGFLMTTWRASYVREGVPDLGYRTRVIVRFLGEEWKQAAVRVEANWQRGDQWDIGVDSKMLDDISTALSAQIGKK
jgi:hypothetical protein